MQLKLGFKSAEINSSHMSLVKVVSAALGGDKKTGHGVVKPGQNGVKDLAAGHATAEQAVAAINAALRTG